ncbi:hypothetical protein R1flu_014706 [Riccia fluitans]|uniref:AAA+ ATPase domain-containing protein n=1 Tax=Riccia fluitans TaxID=41844 RepID=A0ABD1YH68_9MARC
MRRSKFVYKALLQSAASRLPASATAPCCGCGATSTTGREVSGKSNFPQEVNPARASQNWVEILGESRHGRDLGAQQFRRWNHWPSTAAGLILGATTLPVLARNEEDSSGRGDDNDGLRSAEDEKIDMEKVLLQVRKGIVERLDSLKLRASTLPTYNISAKGQQVSIRFTVSPSCDVSHLIVDMVNRLGRKPAGRGGDGEITVQASDSTVARQLILTASELSLQREPQSNHLSDLEDKRACQANNLCILMFEPLIGDIKAIEVEFLKKGFLTAIELDAVISSLRIAGGVDRDLDTDKRKSRKISETDVSRESFGQLDRQGDPLDGWSQSSRWKYRGGVGDSPKERPTQGQSRYNVRGKTKVLEALESMGVKVYGVGTNADGTDIEKVSWDTLAGYHEQKREIEDTVLLALKRPDVYDTIARGTRRKYESNRPRAILFEGPPGTGKTSCARVIANQAGVPLLYVPLEVVMSKYFGESERLLASIFHAGNELPNGAILFLDEIDALATARDSEMHEATRRMLSVLLRQMDGFEQDSKIVVIAATNRKEDLDPALLSRFDSSILFSLPDLATRQDIAAQYAQHLTATELASLAAVSEGMSGRDLLDVCQQAERKWASKIIRGLAGNPSQSLPPIQEYLDCAEKRRQTMLYRFQDQLQLGNHMKQNPDKAW